MSKKRQLHWLIRLAARQAVAAASRHLPADLRPDLGRDKMVADTTSLQAAASRHLLVLPQTEIKEIFERALVGFGLGKKVRGVCAAGLQKEFRCGA